MIKGERLIIGKLEGWPDLKIRVLPAAGPTPNLTKLVNRLDSFSEALVVQLIAINKYRSQNQDPK